MYNKGVIKRCLCYKGEEKKMFIICEGEKVLGKYETIAEGRKAKNKLNAQDYINDCYDPNRYTLYYVREDKK